MSRVISVEPFEPEHLAAMTVQAVQAELAAVRPAERAAFGAMAASTGRCFTIRWADGRPGGPIMCAGALQSHAGHATLWAAFSPDAGRAMLAIERRTRLFIARLPHRRIDAVVRSDHRAGHRFVHRLGLVAEARLNDFYEDGGDAVIYRFKRKGHG
jgi:hypothetical protein